MQGTVRAVAITDAIERARLSSPPAFEGNYDPHVWFDVTLWMKTVEVVQKALSELDPAHANLYQQNASDYLSQLLDLDQYVRTQAARVPEEKRVLITAQEAFSYFGRSYDFQVRGLQGISTAAEAGAGNLQSLADFIVQRQIPVIFVESSVPLRSIEAVKAAVQARGFDVQIGGELFSDAMGTPAIPEGTYLGRAVNNSAFFWRAPWCKMLWYILWMSLSREWMPGPGSGFIHLAHYPLGPNNFTINRQLEQCYTCPHSEKFEPSFGGTTWISWVLMLEVQRSKAPQLTPKLGVYWPNACASRRQKCLSLTPWLK
jgi:hypothetical protein